MLIYFAAAASAVFISTVIILLIQHKQKKLNIRTCLAIAVASLISAAALPGVYYVITLYGKDMGDSIQLIAAVGAAGACLLLGAVLSILISIYIVMAKYKAHEAVEEEAGLEVKMTEADDEPVKAQDNYLEQIYGELSGESSREMTDHAENSPNEADNLEISVDSAENIDKMSIDNYTQDSENLTLLDCINRAYDLKEQGDLEAAVQYFTYALEKKPGRELTFWIVLDICILYKSLGQRKLAVEILNSYYNSFKDIMSVSVKEEIEFNIHNES